MSALPHRTCVCRRHDSVGVLPTGERFLLWSPFPLDATFADWNRWLRPFARLLKGYSLDSPARPQLVMAKGGEVVLDPRPEDAPHRGEAA